MHDLSSPVFARGELESCGQCRKKGLDEYLLSVPGRGLMESGLITSAVCSNCHGAHAVFEAKDPRSLVHPHRGDVRGLSSFSRQRLRQSVHGQGEGPGSKIAAAHGGDGKRKPTCTDCHRGMTARIPAPWPSAIWRAAAAEYRLPQMGGYPVGDHLRPGFAAAQHARPKGLRGHDPLVHRAGAQADV